jgi:hypothetical protein
MQNSSSVDTLHSNTSKEIYNAKESATFAHYVNPRLSTAKSMAFEIDNAVLSVGSREMQTPADATADKELRLPSSKSYSMFQKFIKLNSKASTCADLEGAKTTFKSQESDAEEERTKPEEEQQNSQDVDNAQDNDKVYELALKSVENLQTRSILKHLFTEHQRTRHEKTCLLQYVDYLDGAMHFLDGAMQFLDGAMQFPQYAPILKSIHRQHSCGLDTETFAVGLNEDHQLGLGKTVKHLPFTSKFRKVDLRDKVCKEIADRIQIVQFSCGSLHVAALDSMGCIYTWGAEEVIGRLDKNEEIPTKISIASHHLCTFTSIVCGEYITACLTKDGNVYTFGGFRNSKGQRIGYHKLPQVAVFPTRVKIYQVVASESMLAALDESGSLYCWGNCEFGEGARPPFVSLTPKRVFIPFPIKKIFAFGFSLFLQTFQDDIYASGKNGFGELGLNSLDSYYSPVRVPIDNVKSITGGIHHSLVLKNNGTVYGCGKNVDGQLGLGNSTNHNTIFQQIQLPDSFCYPAIHIAAGTSSHHSCKPSIFFKFILRYY